MEANGNQNYGLEYILEPGKQQAIVHFTLPHTTAVILKIMNAQNKEVRVLLNELLTAGSYQSVFSFGKLDPGDYTIKLIVQTENIIDINSLTIQIP